MRLIKKTYKDPKTNQVKELKKWYIEFKDHNEQIKRLAAFSDKARSTELGRKVDSLVFCRITGEQPDPTLNQWLETLPGPLRDRLGKLDLLDGRRLAACKVLTEHLEDFKQSMLNRDVSERQAIQVYKRALKVMKACKFTTWSDIQPEPVLKCLHDWRNTKKKPIAAQTSNFYLQASKQFCRWMVRDRRATESPLAHLEALNVKAHPQRERRAFTSDELRKLIDTTWNGPDRRGRNIHSASAWFMTGKERAVLYMLAVETGLRANELRSLTRSSFDLESEVPTVTVQAAYTKRRRKDVQPIKPETAELLPLVMYGRSANEQLFTMPRREDLVRVMFKPDLEAAGIAYKDETGRVADFHALRHTFITNLAQAGVHPKTAQALARHSTITLTMDRYTHALQEDQTRALDVLPSLRGKPVKSEVENDAPHDSHGALYGAQKVRKHAPHGDNQKNRRSKRWK